jgi:hypothetical protein
MDGNVFSSKIIDKEKLLFIEFYIILIDYNVGELLENIKEIFSTFIKPFKFNLWLNFALNFKDPTFYTVLAQCKNQARIKFNRIFHKISNLIDTILERSK